MELKPGPQCLLIGIPGAVFTFWIPFVGVALAFGGDFSFGIAIFTVGIIFSSPWLMILLYFAGTRLRVDTNAVVVQNLFGLRRKSLAREDIARVGVSTGTTAQDDYDFTAIPVSYYGIIDKRGNTWLRLSTWFWRKEDCERLRVQLQDSRRDMPSS